MTPSSQPSPEDSLTRKLRDYYDRTPEYHQLALLSPGGASAAWDPNARVLRKYVRAGERLLDLAGGASGLRARLPPCRYVPTDISLTALNQGGGGVLADARHLPFRDGTFDVVLCHHGLEHFAEPRAALEQAVRLLAPGGRLLLIGPSFDSPRQPLPMLAHLPPAATRRVRFRLLMRLVRNELQNAIGRFRYEPLILNDVASFHGVGPPTDDYDAVHPTQIHETAFLLAQHGLELAELTLWGEHCERGPGRLQRALSHVPFVRWFIYNFPLVAVRPAQR